MIYMTARDEEEARRIASALLERRLIACANILPIQSLYRWKGRTVEDVEAAVIMKTKATLVDKAIAEARRLHSYEVPCLVAYPMETGLTEYLGWIEEETASP